MRCVSRNYAAPRWRGSRSPRGTSRGIQTIASNFAEAIALVSQSFSSQAAIPWPETHRRAWLHAMLGSLA
jgi:hypothetical protein